MRNLMRLSCLACLFVFVAMTTANAEPTDVAKKDEAKKVSVAVITLQGAIPEKVAPDNPLGDVEPNLFDMVNRFDRAAKDKNISAVLLQLRNPSLGRAKIAELRAAIARVRKAGKPVYAEMPVATTADYLLAVACDEIVMPESGTLLIPGVRAEIMFYKNLFDKLGVKAEMMQCGKFKGAAEPYTRTEMSPAFRKQLEMLIDDVYKQMVTTIATDRKLDEKKVRELIDLGLCSPLFAKKAGLIDTVAYQDEFRQSLPKKLNAEEIVFVHNYGKKKVDTDFSGMTGLIKLMSLISGAKSGSRHSRAKKVAIVHMTGAITTGKSKSGLFGGSSVGSATIIRALRTVADDDTVVAVILRVDSPGGSALASDLIWREIQRTRTKKPVIASMGDYAASGGYYVSMGCDKIYAAPGTLTGSIGVVGGKIALDGLFNKVGLTTSVISRGKNSGMLSTTSPFTDSERKAWQQMMNETYRQFTAKAAKGRKMDLKKLQSLAAGRVWSGRDAKANGLVDEIGTLYDTIAVAKKMGGIKAGQKVEILSLPKPKNFFEELFNKSDDDEEVSLEMAHQANLQKLANRLAPGLAKYLGEVETLQRLFTEPSILMMPCRIEIK